MAFRTVCFGNFARGLEHVVSLARRHAVALAFVVAVFVVCLLNHDDAHDWGDDFALYLTQARAVVDADTGAVVEANRYTVENSSWSTFSPEVYPWGWPLLLAPVYATTGLDYRVFKAYEAAFLCGFLLALYLLVQRRAGRPAGLAVAALVGLSPAYVGWTESVVADMPYLFLVGLTLVLIDQARVPGLLRVPYPLGAAVGVVAAYAFSTRREGVALFAALAASQAADWAQARRSRPGRRGALGREAWPRLAAPYLAGGATVLALEAVLYSALGQRYDDTGPGQVASNVAWFRDILAEHVGLKDQGAGFELLGSRGLSVGLFATFVGLAVIGLAYRVGRGWRHDAPLVGYLVAVSAIIATLPFHEGRYLFSITPFLGYFAWWGARSVVAAVVRPARRARLAAVPAAVAVLFLGVLAISNSTDLWHRTKFRLDYPEYEAWGPESASAQELFTAVRTMVGDDEVVGFFRARAMNFYGQRQSLQLTTLGHVLERADWYAMEKYSSYSQYALGDQEAADHGIERAWENERFVLWRVP